ncbi:MAG: hypothetical protein L3J11_06665 [Draconibacterium sp.]|nr:hypothetical protein [Draconibacterium sp.]
MIKPDLNDRLLQTFDICALHLKRMEYAKSKVEPYIPLNRDSYYKLDDDTIGFLDQFIFRFSKLQDIMGSRLFPAILEALAEPVTEKAFIDILNRLEKLGILESAQSWIELRKIRNDIAHEYPASLIERIEGINILFDNLEVLKQIVEKCRSVFKKYN